MPVSLRSAARPPRSGRGCGCRNCRVRGCCGSVSTCDGGPDSSTTPPSMNSTWSATCWAKRISWVTTTIVQPSLRQVLDHLQHLADQLRVQRGRGLVEQHQLGAQRQRAGDADALLLAAGELVGVLVRLLREADLRQQAQRLVASLPLRPPLHDDRALDDVLQHRHVREQVVALEDHAALGAEARAASARSGCRRSRPTTSPMVMTPASAWSSALSVRRTVVLPEPDGPITAVTVPARTSNEMPRRTSWSPNALRTSLGRSSRFGHRSTYLPSRVSSRPWKNERITQITQ